MTKKHEAMQKAKESWKEIVKWWKKFGTWAMQVVWWATWSLAYTLLSAWEKWIEKVSKAKGDKEWITREKRKRYIDRAKKYSEKSKNHINKAWKLRGRAISWMWKTLKWWAKAVWHTVKWGYHLIDAWDKAIWEYIEKKQLEKWKRPWKIWKFIRDNITKLMIALSVAWYWWYKAVESSPDKQEDKIELVQKITEGEQFVKGFFSSPDVMKDLKSSGKEWEEKRKNRYLWDDEAWNNMRNGFWFAERKKVIEWMCRMIESWHLEMVIKKADEAWVPRQCVFLALAESWWQAWANSGVAWWYWQFTKNSAKSFGLIDDQWNDYRSDPEKSTDAAMKHLKENYKIVCNYAKQLWYKLSESDKWIFAFHMYNWSPKLVRKWMVACKWDANKYPEKQTNWENRNYVPRILGIQDALEKVFKENWYDTQKIRTICLNEKHAEKTDADLMYEDFVKDSKELTQKDRLQRLNEIKSKYEEEYKAKLISKNYYEWAIRVINEAIISEDDEDEDNECED